VGLFDLVFLLLSLSLNRVLSRSGYFLFFSILNFTPDAKHHLARILSKSLYLSVLFRNIVVLSVYKLTMSLFAILGMMYPCRFWQFLSVHARGSITRSKSRQESGSSCHTPLITLNGLLITLLNDSRVSTR
jgi:hypothetical protein